MNKIKTTLDRERISSESITEKQDFEGVLSTYRSQKGWSNSQKWLLGSIIGTAVVSGIVITSLIDQDEQFKSTDKSAQKEILSVDKGLSRNVALAFNDTQPALNNSPKKDEYKRANSTNAASKTKAIPCEAKVENKQASETVDSQGDPINETSNVTESKVDKKSTNNMPHIGKYYDGEVPVDVLCSNEKISSGTNLAVVSYVISYYNGREEVQEKVRGALVPSNICESLGKYNLGEPVRITSIVAEDRFSGAQYILPSMSIKPVLGE